MVKASLIGEVYDTTELVQTIDSAIDDEIELTVNSVGGSVFEGLNVVNAIQKHGRVTANIEVMSASIGAVVSLSANKCTIGKNDLMVLHNCWTFAMGNKEELREEADAMEKIDAILHNIILEHCNDAESIEARMNEGDVYLSGDEVAELFDHCELVDRNNNATHQNSIMPKLIDTLKKASMKKDEPKVEPYVMTDELKELLAYDE